MQNIIIRALAWTFICSIVGIGCAKEAAPPTRIAANNAVQLKKMIGQTVTVLGKVSHASAARNGHHFLNFYSSDLSVVCFKEHVSKFKDGGPAKSYSNKTVLVTGKLELYNGKPQIKVTQPQQISLANSIKTEGDANSPKTPSIADIKGVDEKKDGAKKFELKQVGNATWLSPAGIRYSGKDPEGLNRVEHVLRHAKDQPKRAGSHGVFDGDDDQALATIDEAWKLVKLKKIEPREERGRSSYTVSMGRRIGFLGGQVGKTHRHPPLKKVFIVVKTGTSDLVTAFPR